MTQSTSLSNKTQLILSTTILVLGLILLVFMITVESEPGALPLALVLGGVIWKLILNRKIKSSKVA